MIFEFFDKKLVRRICAGSVVGILFLLNCYITYRGTWAFFHSDDATVITFGREQWSQGKLYPDGWYYGTDIWNVGMNCIVPIFLTMCKSWLNARVFAVIVQTAVMLGIMKWFQGSGLLGKKWWFCAVLMLFPASEIISEHWYFQATYMTMVLYLAGFILLTLMALSKRLVLQIAGAVLLFLLLAFRVGTGFTFVLVFACPILLTFILMGIWKMHRDDTDERQMIKKMAVVGGVVVLAVLAGVVYNTYLTANLNLNTASTGTGGYSFQPYTVVGGQVTQLLADLLRLFGAADTAVPLLSLSGIIKVFGSVYMIFMLIFVPVQLIRHFNGLRSDGQRVFVMYSVISSVAVIYFYMISEMTQGRYLIWIYFYMIINLGIWLDNFEIMRFTFKKEIKVGFAVFFCIMIFSGYTYYLTYDYSENPDQLGVNNTGVNYKVDYELADYLVERGYTYGYSNYWQSYCYVVASDGRLEMAAVDYDWLRPQNWLVSEKAYDTGRHPGPCFFLVQETQYENELPKQYKKRAVSEESFHDHRILLYDSAETIHEIWREAAEERAEEGVEENGGGK